MSDTSTIDGFTNVDRAGNPREFTDRLTAFTALAGVQTYKARTYDLLEPREGSVLLDLGCGMGQDVLALARYVGSIGRVVGVDRSETMIEEASKSSAGLELPIEFRAGDAYALDFPDATFDACRADRVFHHLEDPPRAMAELVRVARPGGRIVLFEPDFGTAAVDSPNRALTRAMVNLLCDTVQNGWMGRHLRALLTDAGLGEVVVAPEIAPMTDYATANLILWLERTAAQAVEVGVATADEADTWLSQLREADRSGRFFAMAIACFAWGRKR